MSDHSFISIDVQTLLFFLGVCEGKIELFAKKLLGLLEGEAGLVELTETIKQVALAQVGQGVGLCSPRHGPDLTVGLRLQL